jgi:hypothetical protein
MNYPYAPPYAIPNVAKRPKMKTAPPPPAVAPPQAPLQQQMPPNESKVTMSKVTIMNPTAADMAMPKPANVKPPSSGPKFANPGSGKKNGIMKWRKEEVSCRTNTLFVHFSSYSFN